MEDGTEILRTIHGSHLYGLNRIGSDLDVFRVVAHRNKALVRCDGPFDYREFSLHKFLEYIYNGSHQSLEALFSPYAVIHPHYEPMFRSMRATGPTVFSAYRRTIKAFAHGDEKKRRHAVRLGFNLADLREYGRFNPKLTDGQIAMVKSLALQLEGEELFDFATSL